MPDVDVLVRSRLSDVDEPHRDLARGMVRNFLDDMERRADEHTGLDAGLAS